MSTRAHRPWSQRRFVPLPDVDASEETGPVMRARGLRPEDVRMVAAGGATNREIAQALFVTARTVETHLTAAFRKLGVSSRRDLAGRLADAA